MSVAAALAAQNARLPPSHARDAHLTALAAGAPAVVTGQQVGLFLGPLYAVYKAATAVKHARAIGAVPIFWLQTEDHDLVEIASVGVPGRAPISVPASAEDRVSIAHRTLPPSVTGALGELAAELGGHVHAEAHLARLARHYTPGARWADAFAGVLAELFAPEGLIFLDPRDPAIAALARPVHARALRESRAIADALVARTDALGNAAQVHVRPGAPLSYIHPSGAEGPRFRLAASGTQFAEIRSGRVHDPAELLASLEQDPRFMSTSALLRPILQDTILHTAAYVGGAAEVAYYAQLEPLWPIFGLPAPRVLRRAGFRLIDHGTQRLLDRLGLTPDDAKLPEEDLLARGQPARMASGDLAARLRTPFETAHASVTPEVLAADPRLARELARAKHFVERSVDRLARRYQHALLHADQDRVAAVQRLKLMLHPDAPQERVYGLSWFAARHGDRAIVEHVLAAADPDASMKDLVLS